MSTELGACESPRKWRFAWEAQSQLPTLKLFLFNRSTKPLIHRQNLKVQLLLEKSLLAVSWFEDKADVSLRVPIPRVLVDAESPLQFRALEDHVEVKLVLLLPVNHPILTNFNSVLNLSEEESHRQNNSRPLLTGPEVKSLSSVGEVQFYCRSCSMLLTKSLSSFSEMPSINWREVADNWFGSCCCSFGGISEKLVTKYASSYTSATGVCLLSSTFVVVCKDDLVGCEFLGWHRSQKYESESDFAGDSCTMKGMVDNRTNHGRVPCFDNQKDSMLPVNGKLSCTDPKEDNLAANLECQVSENVKKAESLSCMFSSLELTEDVSAPGCCVDRKSHILTHTRSPEEPKPSTMIELLANQKSFVNGLLGDIFMARASNLSKDVQWVEFLCPHCSCLLGAYPSGDGHAPMDGGVRLFKCYISPCLPVGGSSDLFGKYTLESMFTNQLLDNAEDELSFRTVVRDLQTGSAMLQIILLNPSSWCCLGYCLGTDNTLEPVAMVDLFPTIKVLFSDCSSSNESQLRMVEEWATKNQADEVFMLAAQIKELIECLELAKDIFPPSCTSLQGLSLSSLRR